MNRKLAFAAGLLSAGLASQSAQAFTIVLGEEFTFDGTQFNQFDAGGTFGSEFTATYIDFSYQALIDQTNTGLASANFSETGVGFFSSFQDGLGAPVDSGTTGLNLSIPSVLNGYKMYAVFTGVGTIAPDGGTGIDGTFTSFNIEIWIDDDLDTTLDGANAVISGDTSDDVRILTGTLFAGEFNVENTALALAAGDFDVVFEVTSFDATVWGGPAFAGDTVYGDLNGVNTEITGINTANPFATTDNIHIIGSGNNSYGSVSIPAPGVLGLLGAGLMGMGWVNKRKRA